MSAETHKAILEAVTQLLTERKYSEVTFDRIAEKARVGKAAIFRRWDSKAALVAEALKVWFETYNPEVPNSKNTEENVRQFFTNTVQMLTKTPGGMILRNMISELVHEPSLAKLIHEFETERRKMIFELIKPLKSKQDPNYLVSVLFGPLYFRWVMTHEKIDKSFIETNLKNFFFIAKKA